MIMSRYKNITIEDKTSYKIITICRPEALNALNAQTLLELSAEIDEISKKPAVRALILTGAGEKSFVAGADIKELQNLPPIKAENFSLRGQAVFSKIENFSIPVIAAINGFALGGGLELAIACDIRIASTTSKFALPEVNLGVIPGYGGTQRLSRLIGCAKALELTLTGDMINAEEALHIGLVNDVVPPEELIAKAEEFAKKLSKKAPAAVRFIKELVKKSADAKLEDGLKFEAAKFAITFSTSDKNEGISAFMEKRTPSFKGY